MIGLAATYGMVVLLDPIETKLVTYAEGQRNRKGIRAVLGLSL
jgi:hypothetical protein